MAAGGGRREQLAQGLVLAFAAVSAGIALMLGDITISQSIFGGVVLALAGICWAVATVLQARRKG